MSPKQPQLKPQSTSGRQSNDQLADTVELPLHIQKRLRRCGRKFYYEVENTETTSDKRR